MHCMTSIERVRKERGLTQAQLAALVGVDQPTISRVEHGFRLTDPDKRQALQDFLARSGD